MHTCLFFYIFRYVFLNVGGNDIRDTCEVDVILKNIVHIVDLLKKNGVQHVFVASIVERGMFLEWTGMNRSRFNKVRRAVNSKLRMKYGDQYVNVERKLKYPKHYDEDLIHPGYTEGGMRVLCYLIRHCINKCY